MVDHREPEATKKDVGAPAERHSIPGDPVTPAGVSPQLLQRKVARRLQRKAAGDADGAQGKSNDAVFSDAIALQVVTNKAWLVSSPSHYRTTIAAKLAKGENLQLLDVGGSEKFNAVTDAKYKWWKVKVLDGSAHAGQVGWLMACMVTNRVQTANEGTKEKTEKLGSGEISVSTGQSFTVDGAPADGDNWFTLQYKGIDADRMRWLQFISREIIGVDDKGKSTPQKGTNTNSVGRSYQLIEDGTKEKYGTATADNWNTDTGHPTDPFYEAAGGANRTADSTSMSDMPSAASGYANKAFDDGAKQVVSRAHFLEFLVKDEKQVKARTAVHVEWSFAKKEEVNEGAKGKHTVSEAGTAGALAPQAVADAFHTQFPAYKDLK